MGQYQQWKVQCMMLNAGIFRWVDGVGLGGGGWRVGGQRIKTYILYPEEKRDRNINISGVIQWLCCQNWRINYN